MAVMTQAPQDLKLHITEDVNVFERLHTAKTVLLHKVQEEGFELGVRSGSNLSHQDFQHFENISPIAVNLDEDALEDLWTFLDFKGYPQTARLHDPDFVHLLDIDAKSRIVFAQAWVDGVLSVWQTLKDQMGDAPLQDPALADRLAVEKAALLHKVEEEGFELGVRSSSHLSQKDFQHFEKVSPIAADLDEDALEALWAFLDFKGYPQESRLHNPDFLDLLALDPNSCIRFAQSWLEGVLSVWHTLKPELAVQ